MTKTKVLYDKISKAFANRCMYILFIFTQYRKTFLHFTQWDVQSVTFFCKRTWNNGLQRTSYLHFPTLGSHELLNDGHRQLCHHFPSPSDLLPFSALCIVVLPAACVLFIKLRATVINSTTNISLLINACKYAIRLDAPQKYQNRKFAKRRPMFFFPAQYGKYEIHTKF